MLSSPHYSILYANPPKATPPPGPIGGPSNPPDIAKFLPAPYNNITGNLIPGTNHYSSFTEGGSNPSKGTILNLSYATGTPYGVPQYYWSVYIHSPVLGSIGYKEVDYTPYYSTGLPPGVSAYPSRYLGYL